MSNIYYQKVWSASVSEVENQLKLEGVVADDDDNGPVVRFILLTTITILIIRHKILFLSLSLETKCWTYRCITSISKICLSLYQIPSNI